MRRGCECQHRLDKTPVSERFHAAPSKETLKCRESRRFWLLWRWKTHTHTHTECRAVSCLSQPLLSAQQRGGKMEIRLEISFIVALARNQVWVSTNAASSWINAEGNKQSKKELSLPKKTNNNNNNCKQLRTICGNEMKNTSWMQSVQLVSTALLQVEKTVFKKVQLTAWL